ncbi:MAG: hypothetical protein J5915_07350 [Acidaminococcaceae bacterium]|nr:hypothetical protein [Acidaminococcaceae bacterium]MBO6182883.1 hypothetical protein [Acidaminococcaceae bacterium]MBQ5344494.1 hypothetical protein [Acidaminococcaceae bacterium]
MKRTLSVSLVLLAILCNVTITTSAAVKHDRQNTEVQPMPPETYIAMQRLADYGLVKLPAGCRNVREANFDRHEMAVLALQAIKRIGMDENGLVDGNRNYRLTGYRETLVVKDILNQELKNMGMGQESLMDDLSVSSEAGDLKRDENRKYKISAELRYNYVKHGGNKKWDWNDSRLRARLFLEARINDDWHAFGMVEANKHFLHQHGDDDWLEDKRFYVRGITGDTVVTAGWYGYMLGEGNIFDSSVAGATANFGSPVNYELTAARTKSHSKMVSGTASMTAGAATYGGGLHHFSDDNWGNEERWIWHAFYNYRVAKDLGLGAMYIGSDLGDKDGKKHGFVGTVSIGKVESWKPGTDQLDFKYYYQPRGTYIAHTMTGLADYMDGYRGPGVMYHRTLFPNVVLNMEYYVLRELTTGNKGRTWWTDVTCYF